MSAPAKSSSVLVLVAILGLTLTTAWGAAEKRTEEEAFTLGVEAYVYGYPLVLMDVTRQRLTNVAAPIQGRAPINQFGHRTMFPTPESNAVVTPNADTLYSLVWLDLKREPLILHVPDTAGRYYIMPLMDAWTNVFSSLGKRTTGTGEGHFAILGPGWKGKLPEGVTPIRAPTNLVWLIGRTQANGKADFPAVHAIQKQYRVTPLSAWGKPYTPPTGGPIDPTVNAKTPTVEQVAAMDATSFFQRLARLLKDNPPHAADAEMIKKLERLGIVPGKEFVPDKLDSATLAGLRRAVKAAQQKIAAELPRLGERENGWLVSRNLGSYGTDYLRRAVVAHSLLAALLPEDALYYRATVDSAGRRLSGANRYVLHFARGQTPPVRAFWSLTMYNTHHFFVANPIDRYAIGDRDKLRFNDDGSLDLYIQHESPGKDREANWLPAPREEFVLALRLFWPREEALKDVWKVPAIEQVK
jgi:hypothetical protein